jgi:sRNA-binding carbon storage regulator CsrA
MGLVLELYPDEPYNDFYVDDVRVELHEIRHEFCFKLKVYQPALHKIVEVTDQQAVEIMQSVRVSAGTGADIKRHGVKVVIEAPRRINIDRGIVYRKKKDQQSAGS